MNNEHPAIGTRGHGATVFTSNMIIKMKSHPSLKWIRWDFTYLSSTWLFTIWLSNLERDFFFFLHTRSVATQWLNVVSLKAVWQRHNMGHFKCVQRMSVIVQTWVFPIGNCYVFPIGNIQPTITEYNQLSKYHFHSSFFPISSWGVYHLSEGNLTVKLTKENYNRSWLWYRKCFTFNVYQCQEKSTFFWIEKLCWGILTKMEDALGVLDLPRHLEKHFCQIVWHHPNIKKQKQKQAPPRQKKKLCV